MDIMAASSQFIDYERCVSACGKGGGCTPANPALYSGATRLLLEARDTDSTSLNAFCSTRAPVMLCGFDEVTKSAFAGVHTCRVEPAQSEELEIDTS